MTRIGETDGVGWMRRATTILLEHHLPAYPRASLRVSQRAPLPDDFDPFVPSAGREWHWQAAPDVAAQLRSLHFPGQPAPTYTEELFGYRVDVDEACPAGTLAIVRQEPDAANDAANPPDEDVDHA